jgi:YbbR domain-containing protein
MAPQVRALLRNWDLKLLALALAVSLWLFVVMAEKAEVVLPASLELHSLPAGLEVVGQRPERVEVQLTGLRTSLARLGSEEARVRLSLAGVRPGEVALRVLPEHLELPRGVTAVRISPAEVRVTVDTSRSARVKVLPRLTGTLAPGHRIAAVTVIPEHVEIDGPASQVEGVGQVFTEPVDVSGASGRVDRTVSIMPQPDGVRLGGTRTARVVIETVAEGGPPRAGSVPMASPVSPERRVR